MTQYKRKRTKKSKTKKRRSQHEGGGDREYVLTPGEREELEKKVKIINNDNREKTYWFVMWKGLESLEKVQVNKKYINEYKLKPELQRERGGLRQYILTSDGWKGRRRGSEWEAFALKTWEDIKKGDIIVKDKKGWYKPWQEDPSSQRDEGNDDNDDGAVVGAAAADDDLIRKSSLQHE